MEIKLNRIESNDKEILELILQFLYENKHLETAKLLESRANIVYDQNEIYNLKQLLLNHNYDESMKFLESLNYHNNQKTEVLKILKTRKFLDLIKLKDYKNAMEFVRKDLKYYYSSDELSKLSVLLFNKHNESDTNYISENFSDIAQDTNMINKIQSLLCLSIDNKGNRIIPNARLENMLNSYSDNIMIVDDDNLNINKDKDKDKLAKFNHFNYNIQIKNIIEKHDDEVWNLTLSKSHKYIATCSRNNYIGIFQMTYFDNQMNIECLSYFSSHRKYVTSLQWSDDETLLLTSSSDKSIKLWNPFEGKCLKTYLLHSDIVTSVRWLNNETFVSGSIDKKMIVCTVGNRVICSESFFRIRKILYSDSQNLIIVIPASMNDIILYDYKYYREVQKITELDPIISSSLSLSDGGRFLITNLSKINASINLYDLASCKMINKYYGHTQEQYTIECAFAGKHDEFIMSGSEDSLIFLWHRSESIPIATFKGHTGTVNSCLMSYYNNIPFIFSVSDDFTLRVWTDAGVDVNFVDTATKKHRKSSESSMNKYFFDVCRYENESIVSNDSDLENRPNQSDESD